MGELTVDRLVAGCADEAFDSGLRIAADLEPQAGPRAPVKPAVYEGGRYQVDRRWPDEDAPGPVEVVVIDNVPSQANRLEGALKRHRARLGFPELVLDLSDLSLPVHLPRSLSSFEFPHRNADAYLRDSVLGDDDFRKTDLGRAIEGATAGSAGPLAAWLPQALLFGFWQSHLGKKRQQTKHARSWVSEIVGWDPASTTTKVMGLKGDALNLVNDVTVRSDENDRPGWSVDVTGASTAEKTRLSEIGHGQVPFMRDADATPAAISFARVTQLSTVSFSQLRRVSLGDGEPNRDAVLRGLLVACGLFAHVAAFGGGFSLRSGADLRPKSTSFTWLGATGDADEVLAALTPAAASSLVEECLARARAVGVPLEGWGRDPLVLRPNSSLRAAIEKTWPDLDG